MTLPTTLPGRRPYGEGDHDRWRDPARRAHGPAARHPAGARRRRARHRPAAAAPPPPPATSASPFPAAGRRRSGRTTDGAPCSAARRSRAHTVPVTVAPGGFTLDPPLTHHPAQPMSERTRRHIDTPPTPSSPSARSRRTTRTRSCARRATAGSRAASTTRPRSSKDDKVVLLYRAHADDIVVARRAGHQRRRHQLRAAPGAGALPDRGLRGVRLRGPAGDRDRRHLLPHLHGWDRRQRPLCLATSTDLFTWTKHGPMFPDFNTFLPQGNGIAGPVEQGRRHPARRRSTAAT